MSATKKHMLGLLFIVNGVLFVFMVGLNWKASIGIASVVCGAVIVYLADNP